jgi:hypothetical protein
VRALLLSLVLAAPVLAQGDLHDYRLELRLSYWPVHSAGTIRASGTPIDLRTDLGVDQNVPTFAGSLDFKPSRRQSIRIEGAPVRLDGDRSLARSITWQGRSYTLNDRVTSSASLDYLYAGYQFDVLSGSSGHLGLQAGGAYLSATGSLASQTTGITASKSQTVGLPLAGMAFRVRPFHYGFDIELNGGIKGMSFGRYGNFVEASSAFSIGRGPLAFEAGYRILKADIHDSPGNNQVSPTFRGPVISLRLRL